MTKLDWLLLAGAIALIAVFGYALRAHGQNVLGYAHLGYANVGASVAAAACNTIADHTQFPEYSEQVSFGAVDYLAYAGPFSATASYTICAVNATNLWKEVGATEANLFVEIRTGTTNTGPQNLVGSASDNVLVSTLPTAAGPDVILSFSGTKPTVTEGTMYWVCFRLSANVGGNWIHVRNYINNTTNAVYRGDNVSPPNYTHVGSEQGLKFNIMK